MKHLTNSRSIKDLQDLGGRVALISGGAGFLGSVMASSLAEMGASLAIVDRNKDYGAQVCTHLKEKYACEIAFFEVDLSDDEQVAKVPHLVAERFGSFDILVNAAAIVIDKFIEGWAVPFEGQKSSL